MNRIIEFAVVWIVVILTVSLFILLAPVHAHAGRGYDPNSPIGKWFRDLERPYCMAGIKHCFCCGVADAYPIEILEDATPNGDKPDGLAEITDGSATTFPDGTVRPEIKTGTQFHFAGKDMVKLEQGNPTGTAWVFAWGNGAGGIGQIWCVVPLPPSM